ncbi:hypothetical protein [Saccharolobus islandicus]|uniref:Uncharacterized protein n=1 Tax=Saccharolobus islandicus (strain M.16.4 / Kamchatka \|nr:hypothetical protein [Sulfolobus islandicus]ACR42199.1 conserved hypothetical protein [Sulfolobus islandicus M.16.4]
MSEFDRFINCWLKFRKVDSIKQLEEDCQQLICKFFNAIANDDKEFANDLEEDIEYCRKFERRVTVPGAI